MRKTTGRLVLVALALVPTCARAQSKGDGRAAPRDAVADEVALLRQSVERLAAVVVKGEVLAGRLAAQQLRVLRQEDAIARAGEGIDAAGRRQEMTRATLARVNRALANVVEEPRAEARREVENLNAQLEDQDRELTRLRTLLAQAEQSLKGEQASYAELDRALGDLVREVQRAKP